ncbi:hypothetical protein RJ640_001340 [Escallonia rubra]|uniref:Uncharacterized protein n=1 Tax=Escallonia rubra TaxID=112253 RepID=A0AA88QIK7_9ASTE|nr:hypothetical protein RJ640_001340 [Escallonia rubra]
MADNAWLNFVFLGLRVGQWRHFMRLSAGRGNAAQTRYQGRTLDAKVELEKQAKNDPRFQSYEEDMEVGYEDKPSVLTFEGLELKFQDEILKLVKEHSDAEDAETSRHREKIIEINTQYLEKLSLLRARQANRRDEYLCKETRVRLDQYQQAELRNHTAQTGPNDLCGYGGAAVSDRSRSYYDQHDSHREPPPFLGRGRGLGSEGRVPYPQGRVYNNAGARYR